jgi:hypothetical protein
VVAATPENQKVNLEKVLGVQCLSRGESIPPDQRRLVDFEHVECPRLGAGSLMIGSPEVHRTMTRSTSITISGDPSCQIGSWRKCAVLNRQR